MASRTDTNPRRTWLLAVLPAVLFVAVLGFLYVRAQRLEEAIGTAGSPVIFIFSPDHGRNLAREDQRTLASFLEAESGLAVEIRVASSPLDAIEAFGARADIGLLGLFEYLVAREEYGVRAKLCVLREGGAGSYTGTIIVRTDSPIRSVADLSGRRIAYVDPYSTSGFVFPAKLLADAHVHVTAEFAGSHAEALARVRAGRVDAAATYAGAGADDAEFRSIATTDAIPNEPVVLRPGLSEDKARRLVAALLKFAGTPEGHHILGQIGGISGFRAGTDEEYREVLEIARAAGTTVYDLVPEGVRIESRRRHIDYVP